jgi:hypothetical protein
MRYVVVPSEREWRCQHHDIRSNLLILPMGGPTPVCCRSPAPGGSPASVMSCIGPKTFSMLRQVEQRELLYHSCPVSIRRHFLCYGRLNSRKFHLSWTGATYTAGQQLYGVHQGRHMLHGHSQLSRSLRRCAVLVMWNLLLVEKNVILWFA